MGSFSIWHWLIIILLLLPLYFFSRVIRKAGFSPWWTLLALVPLVNLAMLWVFAYAKWPALLAATPAKSSPACLGPQHPDTVKISPSPITSGSPNMTTLPVSPTAVDEDRIYALIAEELDAGRAEKGLWTRLFAECGGDEKETRVLYIKQRAQRLISGEQARLEQLAHEQAVAAEKAEMLRLEGLSLREKLSTKNITKELSNRIFELSKTYNAVILLNKVRLNHVEDVLALLNQEPLLVAVSNSEGDTALHIALRERYPSMVQLLLEKGAQVDTPNAYGLTPIELASKSDRPELARLLATVA